MLARTWIPKPPRVAVKDASYDPPSRALVIKHNRQTRFEEDVKDEIERLEIEFDKKLKEMLQKDGQRNKSTKDYSEDHSAVDPLPLIEPIVVHHVDSPLRSPRWDGMVFLDGHEKKQRIEKQMKYKLQLENQQSSHSHNNNVSPIQVLQQQMTSNDILATLQNNSLQIGNMRISTAEMKETKRRQQQSYLNQLNLDVNAVPQTSIYDNRNSKTNAANNDSQMDIQKSIESSMGNHNSNGYYSNIDRDPLFPLQNNHTPHLDQLKFNSKPRNNTNQSSSLVGSPFRNEARNRLIKDIYSAHPLIQGNDDMISKNGNTEFRNNEHQFVDHWKPSGKNKTFKEVNSIIQQKKALEMQIADTRRRKEEEKLHLRLQEEEEDRRVRAELERLSNNNNDAHIINNIKGSVAVEIKAPKRAAYGNSNNNNSNGLEEITRLQDMQTRAALARRGKKFLVDKLHTHEQVESITRQYNNNNDSDISNFEVANNSIMRNANRNKNLNVSEESPLNFTNNNYKQQEHFGEQIKQPFTSPQKQQLSPSYVDNNTQFTNQPLKNNNNDRHRGFPKIHIIPNNFIEQHVSYDIAAYNKILANLRPDSAEEVDSFLVNWQRQVHENAFNYNINKLLVYNGNPNGDNTSDACPKNQNGWFVDSHDNLLREEKSRFIKADLSKNGRFGNDSSYFLSKFKDVYGKDVQPVSHMEGSLRSESNWLEFTDITPIDTPADSSKTLIEAPPDSLVVLPTSKQP